jgi:hypothetical protein
MVKNVMMETLTMEMVAIQNAKKNSPTIAKNPILSKKPLSVVFVTSCATIVMGQAPKIA